MAFTKEQENKLLVVLFAVLAVLVVYRTGTSEKPKTAPLTYGRGAVATSPVRKGPLTSGGADPLLVFLERREEKFSAVVRDIFRMENPAPKKKPVVKPAPALETRLTPTLPPAPPEKTYEEIAAEMTRADLSKFRFLGYLTDKDNTLFLSKDGELFIVKSGDSVLKNYKIKEAGKDYVVLLDTITRVEVRIELSGADQAPPLPQQQQRTR